MVLEACAAECSELGGCCGKALWNANGPAGATSKCYETRAGCIMEYMIPGILHSQDSSSCFPTAKLFFEPLRVKQEAIQEIHQIAVRNLTAFS